MGLFSSKRTVPPKVSTDTVIPLRFVDGLVVPRAICNELTYCFDDKMDAGKLRASLETLVEKDEWRKLGARLRLAVCFR